jgi:hypothetical protein
MQKFTNLPNSTLTPMMDAACASETPETLPTFTRYNNPRTDHYEGITALTVEFKGSQ